NQLLAVQDMSNSLNGFRDNVNNGNPDYGYDVYGNMTSDANKRIEDIDYNHLNLPTVINFQNNSGRIRYTYDALGVKLRKEVDDPANNTTTTTEYLDGFQYKNEALIFFPTSEGYVEFATPTKFFYVYNYTDHLGNVRMSYTEHGPGVPKILEDNHYYPFGLRHENYASERFERVKEPNGDLYVIQPTERREWQYKYNGKEWQDELGLNFYDYGARNYDAAIGRWMNVDPLAEQGRRWSPYNYAMDNPVYFIDPDGMWPDEGKPFPSDNRVLRNDTGVTKSGVRYSEKVVGKSTSIYEPMSGLEKFSNAIGATAVSDLNQISNTVTVTSINTATVYKDADGNIVKSAKEAKTVTEYKQTVTESGSISSNNLPESVSTTTTDSVTTSEVVIIDGKVNVSKGQTTKTSPVKEQKSIGDASSDFLNYAVDRIKKNIEINAENNQNYQNSVEKLRDYKK
ncbi:RHS repeat domain-containing protein, partial [Flavobacterium sp.]|uniref:RHS repeat domain-containing protein n=1 Tax=Flavobacterium sp. TaxID=239 RepID=UPI003B99DEB9